jgi:hypothetical protein
MQGNSDFAEGFLFFKEELFSMELVGLLFDWFLFS